jgi:hypothetical protein
VEPYKKIVVVEGDSTVRHDYGVVAGVDVPDPRLDVFKEFLDG